MVEINFFEISKDSDYTFTKKSMTIGNAFTEVINQVNFGSGFKHLNPFYRGL